MRWSEAQSHEADGWLTIVRLLAVIGFGLVLRAAFFNGFVGTDDRYYIAAAHRVSVGDWAAFDSRWAVRSGLVLPTALAYAAFGVSRISTALWPWLCSCLEGVVAFALGTRLFGTAVGLLAALLLAFFPLDVIFATELFPCVPIGLFTGLTLYFVLSDEPGRVPWRLAVAGLCFGIATLVGDTAWLCSLPLGAYCVFGPVPRRRWVFFAIGLGAIVVCDSGLYLWLAGDPMRRWNILAAATARQGSDAMSSGLGTAYLVQPFLRVFTEQELALFPAALVPALAWHVWRRPNERSRLLAFWVVSIFLYSSYGTVSPFRFAPLPRLPRYLSSTTIPAMVLVASFLLSLRPRLRNAIFAVLCMSSLAGVWIDNGRSVRAPQRALAAFVASHPDEKFVVDEPLLFDVQFSNGFRPDDRLAVLVANEDDRQRVAAQPSLYRAVPILADLMNVRDGYVAVSSGFGRDALRGVAGMALVASFRAPDRLYYRLLRRPAFLHLLALTRERHRMEGLQQISDESIDVYHVS